MTGGLAKVVGCGTVALLAAVLGACGDDDETVTSATEATAPDDGGTDDTDTDGSGTDGSGTDETAADGDDTDEDADDDSTQVDACAALEGVDLDGLLGAPAGELEDDSSSLGAACTIRYADGASGGGSLAITTSRSAENYENQQELMGVDSEVSGLGDEAFHTGPYLWVLDGERLVRLQIVRDAALGAGVPDADLEAAMTVILGNIAG